MIGYSYIAGVMRVCVDIIENGQIFGQVYTTCRENPLCFSDAGNMVVQVERVLDMRGFPHAYNKTRSFFTAGRACEKPEHAPTQTAADELKLKSGSVITFELHILTRQNATWQGTVDWLDGMPPVSFKSALELLLLIDDRVTRLS